MKKRDVQAGVVKASQKKTKELYDRMRTVELQYRILQQDFIEASGWVELGNGYWMKHQDWLASKDTGNGLRREEAAKMASYEFDTRMKIASARRRRGNS